METYKRLQALRDRRLQQEGAAKVAQLREAQPATKRDPTGPPEIRPSEVVKGRFLADGAFGKVFEGTCRQQPVAIKVLHKQKFDEKALAIFRKEVDILSQIFCPNVCLFMGACFEPGNMMIVTELMARGDMESILRNPRIKLSLLKRMIMARDAAMGMCWLHFGNPVFIHRDLKPGNLLVDENWRVKVCDFGLSQIKKGESLMDGKEGAKGTPLWMAPEVLMGQSFNEAADVYSFAIVLWEILTRSEPFTRFNNYDLFKQAICVKRHRPPIPSSCPDRLAALLRLMWDHDPDARPDFGKILVALDEIIIDVALPDPTAREFWTKLLKGRTSVPWEEFRENFSSFMGLGASVKQDTLPDGASGEMLQAATTEQLKEFADRCSENYSRVYAEFTRRATMPVQPTDDPDAEFERERLAREQELNFRCLRAVLSFGQKAQHLEVEQVDIAVFGKMLHWLGPIQDPAKEHSFLDRLRLLLSKPWFHGDLDANEADGLLRGRPDGMFMVRFSGGSPGWFTVSKVQGGKTYHQRIVHSFGTTFAINSRPYPSLEALVHGEHGELKLGAPCPGSKYHNLFIDDQVSGYLGAYVESDYPDA